MKLSLVKTAIVDGANLEVYKIADYTVHVSAYKNGRKFIIIRKKNNYYLPVIYCNTDMQGNVIGFGIQPTSYGILSIEKTKKMIIALEEAVKVAEVLTKEFVKEK